MRTLTNLQDYLQRDSSRLADTTLLCSYCGREHKIPFGQVEIGSGAIQSIPAIARRILGHSAQHAYVVYDRAIEDIIQAGVMAPLEQLSFHMRPLALGKKGHLLDSEAVLGDQAAALVGADADILIGAGSGVICDLTKWIATRTGKPFITCASAPSMNAYTSITATITKNDIKVSEWLNPANAVVMDIDLLINAPMPMIHAGMGDLAARAICNADWKLGQLLKGSYFCPLPYQMTAANEERYLTSAHEIALRTPQAIGTLSEAILISGYSMTVMDGETSSSSGGEHVLSHFWDYMVHLRGAPKNLHGAQVGIGTLLMLTLYDYMRHLDPSTVDPQRLLRQRPSFEQIQADNQAHFGDKADSFTQVVRNKYLPEAQYLEFIRHIQVNWDSLWQELTPYIGDFDHIHNTLAAAGVPLKMSDIQRNGEDAREALLFGWRYRARYTLLDLAWELGIFPSAVDEILQRAAVL
jgi:glycerol-1-phosphate dehydrogenase [NAD(P)+]